ncbi:MAG: TCR/Tet family MFS transporter [Gammaproteobacteria bacterium]|nr:TCR/Tet family MFS transporter [Gammaproteobacteria bacterium]
MTPPQAGRKAIVVVLLTVFIDTTGFGITLPVMPELLRDLTGKGLAQAAIVNGWLTFAFALTSFFCAPLLGNLSDRFGRRPVLLFSLLAFGLDYLVMGFAPTLGWLFAGRIVAGVAGASYTPAYAYIADISPPEKRAQNFGLVGAAFGLGFIAGPAIGGLLGELGPRAPFIIAGVLALCNFLFGYFALPETLAVEARRPFDWSRANPLGTLQQMRHFPFVLRLLLITFLWQLAMEVLPTTWAFYTMLKFDWSEVAVGYSLAFVGVIMAITQGGLTRVLIPRLGGERNSALLGLFVGVLSFLGYAFSSTGWMIYACMLTYFIVGLTYPSLNALMSRRIPASAQGELQGGVASLYSLSIIIGPPLFSSTLGYFSGGPAPIYFPGAAFVVAALLAACGVALLAAARETPASAS